jgi:Tfp pilus assembly protein PilO
MVVLDYFGVVYIAIVFFMLGMGIMHWAYSPEREEIRELRQENKKLKRLNDAKNKNE